MVSADWRPARQFDRNYPHGDEAPTIGRWTPPDVFAGTGDAVLNRILDEIDAGLPNRQRYSAAPTATNRAAWRVITKHLDRTEQQARAIVKAWLTSGLLIVED
jgi:hypothetical protein